MYAEKSSPVMRRNCQNQIPSIREATTTKTYFQKCQVLYKYDDDVLYKVASVTLFPVRMNGLFWKQAKDDTPQKLQLKPHGLKPPQMYKTQLHPERTRQQERENQFSHAWISAVLPAEITAIKKSTPVDR